VDLDFDLSALYRFLDQDSDAVLTFYGGEPLLTPGLIREIMDHAVVKGFILHTNGTLLQELGSAWINRFDCILVSIDGPEPLNDRNRGCGTYQKIMENVIDVNSRGYPGEIIARMTVTEETDIYQAVSHLAENESFSFPSIHWQIDANLWPDSPERGEFEQWVRETYNPGVSSLVESWLSRMAGTGFVPRWYPFLDTMEDLLYGRETLLRCGSGHANYSIMTDGSIVPCPIMVGMKPYYLGHVLTSVPSSLPKVPIRGPCTACRLFSFCGGRCLYASITNPWPEHLRKVVCSTVENLHASLTAALPGVKDMISEGTISLRDFAHQKFNSCEIIP
jgi:putative peptide-modifying radical SAM enzyme